MILTFLDNRGSRGFIIDTDVELDEPTPADVCYDDTQVIKKYMVRDNPDSDTIVRLFEYNSRFERFLSEFKRPLPPRCIVDEIVVYGGAPIVFIAQQRGTIIDAELNESLKSSLNVSVVDGMIIDRCQYQRL